MQTFDVRFLLLLLVFWLVYVSTSCLMLQFLMAQKEIIYFRCARYINVRNVCDNAGGRASVSKVFLKILFNTVASCVKNDFSSVSFHPHSNVITLVTR